MSYVDGRLTPMYAGCSKNYLRTLLRENSTAEIERRDLNTFTHAFSNFKWRSNRAVIKRDVVLLKLQGKR